MEYEPKIYVACLAAYNNGRLHSCWIDANQSAEKLQEEVQRMLADSPEPNAEEWAIHDYEDFGGYFIEENTDLETVANIAAWICEHGQLGAAILEYAGGDLDQSRSMLEDQYHGLYESEKDFTESFFEETHEIPEYLVCYIDYELMARDWFISDFMSLKVNHQAAVFSVC
jgi:antirestriction protein